jgi:glucosamine 6-phosphate synthetase-like amidotransferase/phosphosugar isomerase protein
MGTKGTEQNNDNNHPIETHRYIGIHNGMIWNDDELFHDFDLFRQGQVDSEVIFRLMDKQGKNLTMDKIQQVAEELSGSFTIAFVDKSKQNILHLVRNDNPVTLLYIPEMNLVAFASERKFLEDALQEATASANYMEYADPNTVQWFIPNPETIMTFDTNNENILEQLQQIGGRFTANYGGYWNRSKRNAYSYDLKYYGLDEEEINEVITFEPEDATIKNNTATISFQSVCDKLSPDEQFVLFSHMEAMESQAWGEGYNKGRESLANELEQVRSIYYDKGFDEGFHDGHEAGLLDAKKATKITV